MLKTNLQSNKNRHGIVGGKESSFLHWGWMISIRFNNGHRCGGSLIKPNWVIE